jgi:hypothetical protein
MFELANSSERATIAIGSLRGDLAGASDRMEELHGMAETLGVSFEDLAHVEQRFAAFGLSVDQSRAAMHAAVETAAALNISIGEAANAIDRMAISGMFNTRQLASLGLSTEQVATVMGIATDKVAGLAKEMDFSGRVAVLEAALQKFDGTAEKVADSFSGRWNRVKEEWNRDLEEMGTGIEHFLVKIAELRAFQNAASDKFELSPKDPDAPKKAADAAAHMVTVQEAVAEALKNQAAEYAAAHAGADELAAAHDRLRMAQFADLDAFHEMTLALQKEAIAAQGAGTIQYPVDKAAADNAAELTERLDALRDKVQELQGLTSGGVPLMGDLGPDMETLSRESMALPATFDRIKAPVQSLAEALKVMGITGTDAEGNIESKMAKATETFLAQHESLANLETAWTKVGGAIDKLPLPQAIKLEGEFIAQLQAAGAPEKMLLDLEEKLLQNEIKLAEQQGQDASNLMIELANVNEQTKILNDTTNIWGRAYTSVTVDIDKAFSSLGSNISAGIMQGENFSKIWQTIWKGFAQEILNVAITAIEQWAEKYLISAGIIHTATAATTAAQTAAHTATMAQKAAETTATAALAAAQKADSAALIAQMGAEEAGLGTLGTAWGTFDASRLAGIASLKAAETVAAVGEVSGAAGIAGAFGFASVMEALPFPVNILTAPAVAAAAVAGTEAAGAPALAGFAEGGFVGPAGGFVHPGEYVTPAASVSRGEYGPPGTSSSSSGGGIHVGDIHFHGLVMGSMDDLVDAVSDGLIKGARRAGADI